MNQCKICGSKTELIIDFGQMPIANAFIVDPKQKEFFYHLQVAFCPKCLMVQLAETVKPEMMFHDDYQFISSTSSTMARHFKQVAQEIIKKVSNQKDPFVVELGSNDGIMLKHLVKKNIRHLGVDPAGNVADMARQQGVQVLKEFFNKKTATKIAQQYGQADIICGSNVFCHIEDINSVFAGISHLLKPDGIAFFEDPYIYDIVKKSSFDQIYDEHIYYYSGLSVSNLADRHGLKLVDMKHEDVHGGSMRYYLKKSPAKISSNVNKYLSLERKLNLHQLAGYSKFRTRVNKICQDLKKTLIKIKKSGHQTVGYGATSKSTTTLNYAKIGPDLIDYISDTTPSKISKYTPGTHIPIKSYDYFIKDQPSYSLLFAWNHQKEIFTKEKKYRQNGGKFITYFPQVKIHD